VRVVFDSNVLVSALVFPGGRADAAMERVLDGADTLLLSRAILGEVLRVLAKKFGREREELSRVAVFLTDVSELVRPTIRLSVLGDEPDHRILECAVAGRAQSIVTGDKAILKLGSYRGIDILRLSGYLETR
jgi:uncharacterized protein